jgi:nitrite reductase/ring-hydroxylating ferredoxin subunit
MNINIKSILTCLVALSCTPDLSDDPIPTTIFPDIVMNLNLPEFNTLRTNGYMYRQEGVRGIIIYKNSGTQYTVYERNCSYNPNSACATVEVHASGLYLQDPCCQSTFNITTGVPTGGPAWRPLRRYNAYIESDILTITDDF